MCVKQFFSNLFNILFNKTRPQPDCHNTSEKADFVLDGNNGVQSTPNKCSSFIKKPKTMSTLSSSIRLLDSTAKEWILRCIQNDTIALIEMLKFYPEIVAQIDPISGFTGLHWAAKHGNLKMVNTLGRSNLVNVNQKSKGGYTPLHIAQQYGNLQAVDALVNKYKADTNVRDNYGFKHHQYSKPRIYNRLLLSVLL